MIDQAQELRRMVEKSQHSGNAAVLMEWLRVFGVMLSLSAFTLTLVSALMTDIDPLWAIARAATGWAMTMIVYSLLCRLAVPLFSLDSDERSDDVDSDPIPDVEMTFG